jgi:hypothetical protein
MMGPRSDYWPGVLLAQAIDGVIREGLAQPLKADGYRKSGRNFHLSSGGVIRVVNAQGSQGNAGGTGRFYVNLGVYIDRIAHLLGKSLGNSKLPKEYQCTIRLRLEELMPPGNNDTWDIGPGGDLRKPAQNLQQAWLEYGKPWMDQNWGDLAGARDLLVESHWYEPAIAASILLKNKDQAQRLSRKGYEWIRDKNPRFAEMILHRAEELAHEVGL